MRVVFADLVETNGKPGEGWHELLIEDGKRTIRALILRLGDVRGEPWNFFAPDKVYARHYTGTASTRELALAMVVDAAAAWSKPGTMPRHAVTGDSRTPPDPVELRPLAVAVRG